MSSEWRTTKLLDHYEVRSGLSKPAKDFGSGYPFLSFKDVFYNFFTPEVLGDLVQSTEKERAVFSVQRGDVFLTRTSETMNELGMSCVALRDYPEATFNGFCKRLRPKTESELVPEFVGYFLRSPTFRQIMLSMSTMSTRASLNNEMIERLDITYPDMPAQKAIASVLKSLDDRITLLRETNATLESIAQALFKSWFVDFDPVHANAARKQSQDSGDMHKTSTDNSASLPDDIAALFPDGFEESELGLIPEGWRVGTLADLAQFQNGYAFKSKDWQNEGHPVVKIGDVKPGFIDFSGCSYVSSETVSGLERFQLKRGDLLVGMTGYVGETGLVSTINPAGYINQRVGRLATPNGIKDLGFIYCAVRDPAYKVYAESQSQGSAQANVSGASLLAYSLVIPEEEVLNKFNQVIKGFIEKLLSNYEQAQSLIQLRDTLLSRLISGQLRLPDFDSEEVV